MTAALFTSLHGGDALQGAVIDLLGIARDLAQAGTVKVEVQILSFAFTDPAIATALADSARACPGMTIRIIADWSQSAYGSASVLRGLAQAGLPNLFVKFKLDAPYRANPETGALTYSYGASLGMMHHKTLTILADGEPVAMGLGSYNWSARGRAAYENLLLLGADPQDAGIMSDMVAEFTALWSDHRLTATAGRATAIIAALKTTVRRGKDIRDPKHLAILLGVRDEAAGGAVPMRRLTEGPVITAFSGSLPTGGAQAGHAVRNDRRALMLLRPTGTRKPAPLTLNTLALEAIRSVPSGARLLVAMYALSPRVPEYGALLDAARRGVTVQVMLDGKIGRTTALDLVQDHTGLQVRAARRRMHQKYLCCPETGMVLTGTANMTEDATLRHSDHRILWRSRPDLATGFAADFDTIWARTAPLVIPARAA